MALADWAAFREAVADPHWSWLWRKTPASGIVGGADLMLYSGISVGPYSVADPSTSVALDNTSGISIAHPAVAGRSIVTSFQVFNSSTNLLDRFALSGLLIDRLVHQGGLVGNVITLQTTNLPTAALTRHTSGVGVMIGLDFYTVVSPAPTTITVVYTNQSGAGGRSGYVVASAFLGNDLFLPVSLQAGDTGVRSVESVQFSNAFGGAGNVGVVLFKPLALLVGRGAGDDSVMTVLGWNTGWETDACLQVLPYAASMSGTGLDDPTMLIHTADV